jgi:membrane associated rhomboid family serine protease
MSAPSLRPEPIGLIPAGVRAGLWLLAIGLVAPASAWAYLDPATGSAALQALIGGVLGGLFLVKRYWRQLRDRLRSRRDDADRDPR